MRAKEWQRGFLVGVLLLVSLWLVSLIWGLTGKVHIAVSQAKEAKQRHEALEARKFVLESDIARLATDRGQDSAIRTSFGVARPGEEVIVVVPPATTTEVAPLTWWQKILSWF